MLLAALVARNHQRDQRFFAEFGVLLAHSAFVIVMMRGNPFDRAILAVLGRKTHVQEATGFAVLVSE